MDSEMITRMVNEIGIKEVECDSHMVIIVLKNGQRVTAQYTIEDHMEYTIQSPDTV